MHLDTAVLKCTPWRSSCAVARNTSRAHPNLPARFCTTTHKHVQNFYCSPSKMTNVFALPSLGVVLHTYLLTNRSHGEGGCFYYARVKSNRVTGASWFAATAEAKAAVPASRQLRQQQQQQYYA